MRTHRHRNKEIERATVGMRQWQETELTLALEQQVECLGIDDVSRQVITRQHNTLAEAGRTRGIVQLDNLIVIQFGITDLFPRETMRIGLGHL